MKKQGLSFFCILLAHCLLVFNLFPLGSVLDANPIFTDDYPVHYAVANSRIAPLQRLDLKFYNPSFGGGNFEYLPGGKLTDLTLLLASFGNSYIVFKLYVLFLNLCIPFVFYFFAKNFGLGKRGGLLAACLGTGLWNLSAFFHMHIYYGLYHFIFASMLFVLSLSFFHRFSSRQELRWLAMSILSFGYLVLLHTIGMFLAPFAFGFFFLISVYKKHRPSTTLVLFILTLFFLLMNIIPFLVYRSQSLLGVEAFHNSSGLAQFINELSIYPLYSFTVLLGLIGLFRFSKSQNLCLVPVIVPTLLVTYFGNHLYLPQTQRLAYILCLLLFIPAVGLLASFRKKAILMLGVLGLIYLFSIGYPFTDILTSRLSTAPPARFEELKGWLAQNANPGARVLFEGSCYRSDHFWTGHIAGLLQHETGLEFAGQVYPYISPRSALFSFAESDLAANGINPALPLGTLQCSEIMRFSELLNIGWIVAWHSDSIGRFEACEGFELVYSSNEFKIFSPEITHSFFLEGNGSLAWISGCLEVNLTQDPAVIKYRWHPSLAAENHTEEAFPGRPLHLIRLEKSVRLC
jgi:hypothetical protein